MAKGEPKKLDELFHDTLKDIYYAERHFQPARCQLAAAWRRRRQAGHGDAPAHGQNRRPPKRP
jgi:hypothetical protein